MFTIYTRGGALLIIAMAGFSQTVFCVFYCVTVWHRLDKTRSRAKRSPIILDAVLLPCELLPTRYIRKTQSLESCPKMDLHRLRFAFFLRCDVTSSRFQMVSRLIGLPLLSWVLLLAMKRPKAATRRVAVLAITSETL